MGYPVSQVTYTVQIQINGAWTSIGGEGVRVARDVAIRIADDETRAGERARIMRTGAGAVARWWEVVTHRGGPVLAVAHSDLDATAVARFGWLVVVERWRCYACDAVATGRRDLSHFSRDGVVEPACERHRDDRPATIPDFGADADAAIDATIATFPTTFGLRAYPGETFRASRSASYVSRGQVVVYTQRRVTREQYAGMYYASAESNPPSDDALWLDFAKGSPAELRAQIIALEPEPVAAPESAELVITADEVASALRVARQTEAAWAELSTLEVMHHTVNAPAPIVARAREDLMRRADRSEQARAALLDLDGAAPECGESGEPFAFRATGRRQAHKTDLIDVARALGAVVASGDRAAVPWLRELIATRLPGLACPTGQQTCKGDLVAIARALDLDVDDRFACDALRRCIASRIGGRS